MKNKIRVIYSGFCDNACKQCKCVCKFDAYNDSDGFYARSYEAEVNQEQLVPIQKKIVSKDQKMKDGLKIFLQEVCVVVPRMANGVFVRIQTAYIQSFT